MLADFLETLNSLFLFFNKKTKDNQKTNIQEYIFFCPNSQDQNFKGKIEEVIEVPCFFLLFLFIIPCFIFILHLSLLYCRKSASC